eukprot:Seg244.1 transcript_id=Seg244.1/GoldUCD/mRNA.D3Y31 product="Fanconi anemia group C protein" protein_id=Seg244.1/GoldUCD/D3Y31
MCSLPLEICERRNQEIITRLKEERCLEESSFFIKELTSYLQQLKEWMKSRQISDILKQLPNTGKLLSRTVKLCKQLQHGIAFQNVGISEVLVECILSFSGLSRPNNSMSTNTERKIQQWAAEQLQSLTSPEISEETANFMDQFGLTPQEIVDAQIKEVLSLIGKLSKNINSTANTSASSGIKSGMKLSDVSYMILPFIDQPEFKPIIEALLIANEKSYNTLCKDIIHSGHGVWENFIQSVTSNKAVLKGLSDRSLVALWRCHLPAFECEVLDLVKIVMSRPYMDTESIANILESHNTLICACRDDKAFRNCAFDLLRESFLSLGCYPSLMSLINNLHICLCKWQVKDETLGDYHFLKRGFGATHLLTEGSSLKDVEKLIDKLAEELKTSLNAERSDRSQIWFMLVQNKHFLDCSMQLAFQGSVNCLESCLSLLYCFYFSTHRTVIMKIFKSFVKSIRRLLHKNILQIADIVYAVDLCKKHMPEGVDAMPLMRDLILEFLVIADASHFILRAAFSLVSLKTMFLGIGTGGHLGLISLNVCLNHEKYTLLAECCLARLL